MLNFVGDVRKKAYDAHSFIVGVTKNLKTSKLNK
jgi:hypothetical protein